MRAFLVLVVLSIGIFGVVQCHHANSAIEENAKFRERFEERVGGAETAASKTTQSVVDVTARMTRLEADLASAVKALRALDAARAQALADLQQVTKTLADRDHEMSDLRQQILTEQGRIRDTIAQVRAVASTQPAPVVSSIPERPIANWNPPTPDPNSPLLPPANRLFDIVVSDKDGKTSHQTIIAPDMRDAIFKANVPKGGQISIISPVK